MKLFQKKSDPMAKFMEAKMNVETYLAKTNATADGFLAIREELNLEIIQMALNVSITKGKDGYKLAPISETAPKVAALNRLFQELDKFYETNYPRIHALYQAGSGDMDIPVQLRLEKANRKNLVDLILSQDVLKMDIGSMQMMQLATIGEQVRHHIMIRNSIIVGGITVGLIGAAVAVAMCRDEEKSDCDCTADVEIDAIDVEVEEIPEPSVDDIA